MKLKNDRKKQLRIQYIKRILWEKGGGRAAKTYAEKRLESLINLIVDKRICLLSEEAMVL